MNEDLPDDVVALIEEVDAFIAAEVRPLEAEGDNARGRLGTEPAWVCCRNWTVRNENERARASD